MERVYTKPAAQEILIKGAAQEGHSDTFIYDYENDDDRRGLGNLFVLGNISGGEDSNGNDLAYATNLVASLAKREYYSNSGISPRDAFTNALRKVNDVVDEFFTKKDAKINIGVFAIAGDQVYISKLGKFKVILSRAGKNIDILNNIELFKKEHVEEKEFSSVISGKLCLDDRLFAFYPNRSITAREKTIKEYLAKSKPEEFADKINEIKGNKENFACTALYINMREVKESAVKARPQPRELDAPPATAPDMTEMTPRLADSKSKEKSVAKAVEAVEEVPKIIPAEFSLGKKKNPIGSFIKRIDVRGLSRFQNSYNPKRKIMILALAAIGVFALGGLGLFAKSALITSDAEKQLNSVIKSAQENLKSAQSQPNDNALARSLLASSLSSLSGNEENKKVETLKEDLLKALDEIDKAQDAVLEPLEALPDPASANSNSLASARQKATDGAFQISGIVDMSVYEGNLYILTSDSIYKISDFAKPKATAVKWLESPLVSDPKYISVDGNIFVYSGNGTLAKYYKGKLAMETKTEVPVSENQFLGSIDSQNLYLISKQFGRIYVISKSNGSLVRTLKIGSSEPIKDAAIGAADDIYLTAADGRIWKVVQ